MKSRAPAALVVAAVALTGGALTSPSAAAQTGCGLSDPGDDRVVLAGGALVGEQDRVGTVFTFGGDVVSRGRVAGSVTAVTGDVIVGGCVGGDVLAVTGNATLLPGARVGGDLISGDGAPEVAPGAVVAGEIREQDWTELTDAPWLIIGAAAWWIAVSLSLLVAGIVMVALLPGVADAAHRAARSQFALTLAMGLAWGVALPAIAGLSFVSLVGIPLGIVLVLALIPTAFIGYLVACHVVGRRIVREGTHPMVAFLAGLGILRALALIPVAGALVWIPAVVVGIGALTVAAMERGGGSTGAQ